MGFIVIAKGRQGLFFLSEWAWTIVPSVSPGWVQNLWRGRSGHRVFRVVRLPRILTYPTRVAQRLPLVRSNWQAGGVFLSDSGGILRFYMLPFAFAVSIGTLALAGSWLYSVRVLVAWSLSRTSRVPCSV